MIVLAPDEKIIAIYPVFCKFGKSTIYMTNRCLAIEGLKVGLFLTLHHDEILGFSQIGPQAAKISWSEGATLVEFVIYGNTIRHMVEKFTKIYLDSTNKTIQNSTPDHNTDTSTKNLHKIPDKVDKEVDSQR